MTRTRRGPVAVALTGLLSTVLIGGANASASPGTTTGGDTPLTIAGNATATPKYVDQRTNPVQPADQRPVPAPLGIDGRAAGASLPTTSVTGTKPSASDTARMPGGPNTGVPAAGPGPRAQPDAPVPTTVNENFDGINQAGGGGAQPSDINASVGPTQILETVNRRVTVFTKGTNGAVQCTNTLAGFLGLGATNVFDPRTLYDNLNDRFIIIATTNGTPGAAPRLFLAASVGGNACGGYFVYTLTFTGGLFPLGTLLDYPILGQDRVSILASTNNFNPGYINSSAWLVSKALVYAGAAVAFPVFAVAFSTAPVTVTGIPIGNTINTFWVAGRPGFGYNLYRHPTAGGAIVLQAAIASAYAAPPRRVIQCGTAVTLDPLDGRVAWAPVQAVNSPFIWFTHGNNIAGFPGVRYGAIDTTTNVVTAALAFHSGTSDDFNPSLAAFETAPNAFYIWLNWAYTQNPPLACNFTSTTVDGVTPGAGVPNLIATDLTLAAGVQTTTNTRFGDYSSVHLDPTAASPTCPVGQTALLAQQYFLGAGGPWATRLSRVSFGPGC